MMISPEAYYTEYLQGKSPETILQDIHELKEEISRLKTTLESTDRPPEPYIKPGPLTRIKCSREYLKMAKKAYEQAGGLYEPTEEEQRDQSFNDDLLSMHKFTLEIGGFFTGYTKYIYTISGDQVLFDADHSFYPKPSNPPAYEPFTTEQFLEGLADLHIGEWKQEYTNPCVLDGTQWSIEIEYDDDREPVKIHGSNAYPYNFENLLWFLDIDEENAAGTD